MTQGTQEEIIVSEENNIAKNVSEESGIIESDSTDTNKEEISEHESNTEKSIELIDTSSEDKLIETNSGKEETDEKKESKEKIDENGMVEIEDADDYLLYLEMILKTIHKRFYEVYDETKEIPDLKVLVPKIRSEVLRGTNLAFSGLVPTQMKLEQSRAYLIARSLGANVSQHISDDTTHLVAATAGTFKVNAARKRKDVHIVTPDWLWCCAERWERVSEKLFPLDPNKPSKMRQPPPHCHSPEHVVSYNDKQEIVSTKPEPKFVDTINPLLSFSNADLDEMNEEFDQFFESDSSSEEEPINIENPPIEKSLRKRKRQEEKEERQRQFFSKAEEDPFAAVENQDKEENVEEDDDDDIPSAKFRRGEDLPSDLDMGTGSESAGSEDPIDEEDDGDWNMMGAALEREFLGLEE